MKDICEAHRRKQVYLGTVAGVLTVNAPMIHFFDRNVPEIDLITSKSLREQPSPGNREPILVEAAPGSFGNAVGLRSSGLQYFLDDYHRHYATYPRMHTLAISLAAASLDSFVRLILALAPIAEILELNFSCPHAKGDFGLAIGNDPEKVASYIAEIRKAIPRIDALLFAKVSAAQGVDTAEIAAAAIEGGADGITAINTAGPQSYIDQESGHSILNNPPDGLGGMSGTWIKELACESVQGIRRKLGSKIPIIGMGGVSNAQDVVDLINAGADLVGIGSAWSRVRQEDWASYISTLKTEAKDLISSRVSRVQAAQYLATSAGMRYRRYVVRRVQRCDDYVHLELAGALEVVPGQFVFLWLPEIGEKPFFVSRGHPLSFLIRRKGPCTEALASLDAEDQVFLRGPYGAWNEAIPAPKVFLLAEEEGVAALPFIASRLASLSCNVQIFWEQSLATNTFVGSIAIGDIPMKQAAHIESYLSAALPHCVDDSVKVLLSGSASFLQHYSSYCKERGFLESQLFFLVERTTLCGVGMCGECECAGMLSCRQGNIVRHAQWSAS